MIKEINLRDHPKLAEAHEFVKNRTDAVIAGGVARDILLGREYNDIDIFVADSLIRWGDVDDEIRAMDHCVVHEDTYTNYGSRFIVGNLDISVLPRDKMAGIQCLMDQFDMVYSQAWLEPTADGFTAKSTELFDDMHERRIIGYYPTRIKGESDHVTRIVELLGNNSLLVMALAETNEVGISIEDSVLPF